MKKILSSILIFCTVFLLATGTCLAATDRKEIIKKYCSEGTTLTNQEILQLESFSSAIQFGLYEDFANDIRNGTVSKRVVEILLTEGYYTEYFQEFKESGLISENYTLQQGISPNSNNEAKTTLPTPEPVVTTKCDEKIMWTKSQVNVRENGSTDYKKVGSLQANEQVTVTGIDSTGWYEIRMADGTVGHVSDKYLTEEDPSANAVPEEETNEETSKRESEIISIDGRTVVWYNAETDKEEEFVFDENVPLEEVEDMAVKHLINGEEMVEPEKTEEVEQTEATEVIEDTVPVETSEDIKEEPVKEEPAETEELEVSEPQEKADETQGGMQTPVIVFVCVLVCLIVVAGIVVMINAKKKE